MNGKLEIKDAIRLYTGKNDRDDKKDYLLVCLEGIRVEGPIEKLHTLLADALAPKIREELDKHSTFLREKAFDLGKESKVLQDEAEGIEDAIGYWDKIEAEYVKESP